MSSTQAQARALREYEGDYRNFTGIATERQPQTHNLTMYVDVDNFGVIRTKRMERRPGSLVQYRDYRYYNIDQAQQIVDALTAAIRRARECPPPRNWTSTGAIGGTA